MKHKPSILFINRVYPPVRGATGRVLRDLAQEFIKDGWDVTILTTAPKSIKDKDGDISLVRLRSNFRGKSLIGYMLVWLRFLLKGLTIHKHDIVVSMTDPPMLVVAGGMIARSKRSKHIHWCHDLYPDIMPAIGMRIPKGAMESLRKLSRKAMKKCDRVIVIGRCMARHLIHSGLDPRIVAVVPNWTERELTTPDAANASPSSALKTVEGARPPEAQKRDANDLRFRVLYSGNLGRAHPIQPVLDAADILSKDHPEIEFLFVGEGGQFDRLAVERAKRGLQNIRFMPFQPLENLRATMESGDVHLITMKNEALGMLVPSKLYAAFAVARPVVFVGHEQSEAARVVRDFNAGTVIAQPSGKKLAEAVLSLRMDGDLWFAAHKGAKNAGQVCHPKESTDAWIKRARELLPFAAIQKRVKK